MTIQMEKDGRVNKWIEKEKSEEMKNCKRHRIQLNSELFQENGWEMGEGGENDDENDDENDEIQYIKYDPQYSIHIIHSYISFEQECR